MTAIAKHRAHKKPGFPPHSWVGLSLVVIFWALNWTLPGTRTHWGFFPMWLGYCLTIDGLVFWRTRTSLLTRSWRKYIGLFLVSAPVWWLFELLNLRTQNWTYPGAETFTPLQYVFWTTLSFTTVIPAVFGSAELIASFDFLKRLKPGPVIATDKRTTTAFFILGWVMLASMLIWPKVFFPFLWLSIYFHPGTDQRLAGEPFTGRLDENRRLASCHITVAGSPADSLLLGNVEFLLLPEMDLPRSLGQLAAHFRDAAAWLWRLPTLRA